MVPPRRWCPVALLGRAATPFTPSWVPWCAVCGERAAVGEARPGGEARFGQARSAALTAFLLSPQAGGGGDGGER